MHMYVAHLNDKMFRKKKNFFLFAQRIAYKRMARYTPTGNTPDWETRDGHGKQHPDWIF